MQWEYARLEEIRTPSTIYRSPEPRKIEVDHYDPATQEIKKFKVDDQGNGVIWETETILTKPDGAKHHYKPTMQPARKDPSKRIAAETEADTWLEAEFSNGPPEVELDILQLLNELGGEGWEVVHQEVYHGAFTLQYWHQTTSVSDWLRRVFWLRRRLGTPGGDHSG